ncbi:MAG: Aminoacyl carrier protein [Hyphomicrobiales bacterium]|jgi:acyl carrier protein|nr:Aminoacyl carrier protein [Hyphomicrobiales bacterium]
MVQSVVDIIALHGRLPCPVEALDAEQDLYAAGLTSFAAVQLMLALEDAFNVEFPERMLNRRSFSSIAAITACITELLPISAAA